MKIIKRLLSVLAATVLCLGVFAFASCGGNSDNSNSEAGQSLTAYEFTLVDESGAPVEGVMLKLCEIVNGQEGNCTSSAASDANGKITFSGEKKVYHVDVITSGYSLVDGAIYTSENYEAKTLVVKAN